MYPPREYNHGIHLAVYPRCGDLSGNATDVNAGLDLKSFATIVSFGDSYTDGGIRNGSTLLPPIVVPPDPEAGGRSTNGRGGLKTSLTISVQHLKIMLYVESGACTDLSLWPSNPKKRDFLGQVTTFLEQSNRLDPDTTLYTIFFGINDYEASKIDGDHLHAAAEVVLNQIQILADGPTYARSFLIADVYGRGLHTPFGEAYKQTIFNGLHAFHTGRGNHTSAYLNFAFADFSRIWDGVLGPTPGYEAFGYTSTDACTTCNDSGCTTDGMCNDPEHYFYWIPGHPSKEGMRIMADYVEEVLARCRVV